MITIIIILLICIIYNVTSFQLSRSLLSHTHTTLYMNANNENEVREKLRSQNEISDIKGEMNEVDKDLINTLTQKRSYFDIVTERIIQSIDDYQLYNKIKQSNDRYTKDPIAYAAKKKSFLQNKLTEKVVILGTGWGSHAFLKTVDASKYDITVISPRNYFMFTPMLAASAVGTVEFRSIIEPIRNVNPLVDYVEATATNIDVNSKKITCQSIKCQGTACDITDFDISYDKLIIAVGATTNTFGIKGVREHCLFLKQIEDAANLRKAIAYCFERANIPNLSEDEIRAALSFVIVGAGPTGVEFTSELRDFLETEGRRYYANILKYAKITLVEAGNAVLAVFDEQLQNEAYKKLTERETSLVRDGIIEKECTTVLLRAGVKEVREKDIELSNGEKIPYGFCVWAAGNGPVPIVLDVVEKIPEQKALQNKARGRLVVDPWLRVRGVNDVYSFGDCTLMDETPLPATAQVASQQGSYLGRLFSKDFKSSTSAEPPSRKIIPSFEEPYFVSERANIGQLGVVDEEKKVEYAKNFQFLNLGILAYIGASQALAQVSVDDKNILGSGPVGFLLWRGIYWSKQVSWRNRILVGIDWVKARLFGRDIGSL